MALIVGLRLLLLVAALELRAFAVINTRGKDPLGWAVVFIAIALLLR